MVRKEVQSDIDKMDAPNTTALIFKRVNFSDYSFEELEAVQKQLLMVNIRYKYMDEFLDIIKERKRLYKEDSRNTKTLIFSGISCLISLIALLISLIK